MGPDNRPTIKLAELPALRDIYRFSAAMADEELAFATRRYEQTLDRRDKLRERTRFGLLALNATSLAALLSSQGTKWAETLQIAEADAAEAVLLHLFGIAAGAIAIWWSGITATDDAVAHFGCLVDARQRKAEHAQAATVEAEEKLIERSAPEFEVPPDYRWSKIDNLLTNLAGGTWLAALGLIGWKVAQQIEWCQLWCG